MRSRAHLFIALLLATLPACFMTRGVTNEPLDPRLYRSLTIGMSAADCVERLGAPTDVVQLGHRFAYRYNHDTTKSDGVWLILMGVMNEDSRQDRAWLFFSEEGKLTHVGTTFASHRAQWAFPWSNVHSEAERRAADRTRPGLSPTGASH